MRNHILKGRYYLAVFQVIIFLLMLNIDHMNKKLIIQKLAFITEEMQQQTQEWIARDHRVNSLEIDAFLSNIRYLIEQSEILNNVLMDESEEEQKQSHEAPVSATSAVPEPETVMQETVVPDPPAAEPVVPVIEEEKKEEIKEETTTPATPEIFHEPAPEPVAEIRPEPEVHYHPEPVAVPQDELDEALEETHSIDDIYLRIEKTAEPAKETTRNEQHAFLESKEHPQNMNDKLKSEQESLLERLKRSHDEKTIGEQLKASALKKDLTFSLNDRFFIINHLFDGHTASFTDVLVRLTEMSDWSSVESYLNNEVAARFKWAEHEQAKEKFFELLRSRF